MRWLKALNSECPKCGATYGERCRGKRGERKAHHRERYGRSEVRRKSPPSEDRVEDYIRSKCELAAIRFEEELELVCRRCESPIERLLMAALFANSKIAVEEFFFYGTEELPAAPDFDESAHVYQQIQIGPYRADIVIWDATLPFNHTPPRLMIVECDGHDFHERTKEQARRDKRRDRFFQSKGFKVLRFTGSEIWADPDEGGDEIVNELARNDYWRSRDK